MIIGVIISITNVAILFLAYEFNKRMVRNMSEVRDLIQSITVQLGRATEEIIALVDELEEKISQNDISVADLTALRSIAQRLDDIVPDDEVVDEIIAEDSAE